MKEKIVTTLAAASMVVLSITPLTGCGRSGSSPKGGNRGGNKLNVYSWGEYISGNVVTRFEEKADIQVVYDVLETNKEMYPVTEAGAVKYDVVCPPDCMIQCMIENGLLAELNFDNIPSYREIGQQYPDISKGFDPGNRYFVSYYWGTVGILYNTERLEEPGTPAPTEWSDLWNERLSGEILVRNSVGDTFTVTLKIKGYSLNSINPDELAEVCDLLIEQKPLVQAYITDQVGDKMTGGEAVVDVIYSGEMLYIQDAMAGQGLDYNLECVAPEEGANCWIDSWVIPANAEYKENAGEWIDFLCRPDITRRNFEYITYATSNIGACGLLDDDPKNSKALFPDLGKLPKCEIIQYLGDDADTIYNGMWEGIKSG